MCLIDDWGGGVSHAIGAGGRDLHERIGGATTLAGLRLLQADPATAAIVVLSKPPAPVVAEHVRQVARLAWQAVHPWIFGRRGAGPRPCWQPARRDHTRRRGAAGAERGRHPGAAIALRRQPAPSRRRAALCVDCLPAARCVLKPPRSSRRALGSVSRTAERGRLPPAHLCLDLGDEQYHPRARASND